jgi:hypothetical protein
VTVVKLLVTEVAEDVAKASVTDFAELVSVVSVVNVVETVTDTVGAATVTVIVVLYGMTPRQEQALEYAERFSQPGAYVGIVAMPAPVLVARLCFGTIEGLVIIALVVTVLITREDVVRVMLVWSISVSVTVWLTKTIVDV